MFLLTIYATGFFLTRWRFEYKYKPVHTDPPEQDKPASYRL